MARKEKKIDQRRRVFVQLPADVGNTLDQISDLMGVAITTLIVECVDQDKSRFLKMLEVARQFHRVATEEDADESTDNGESSNSP